MEAQEQLYKVTVRRRMGLGTTDKGIYESVTLYFRDIGDITFSERLINHLEHGWGEHGKGFTIAHIECLGEVNTTNRSEV